MSNIEIIKAELSVAEATFNAAEAKKELAKYKWEAEPTNKVLMGEYLAAVEKAAEAKLTLEQAKLALAKASAATPIPTPVTAPVTAPTPAEDVPYIVELEDESQSVESRTFTMEEANLVLSQGDAKLLKAGWKALPELIWFPTLKNAQTVSAVAAVRVKSIFRIEERAFAKSHRNLFDCRRGNVERGHVFLCENPTRAAEGAYTNMALTSPDAGELFPLENGEFNPRRMLQLKQYEGPQVPQSPKLLSWYVNLLEANKANANRSNFIQSAQLKLAKAFLDAGCIELCNYQVLLVGFAQSYRLVQGKDVNGAAYSKPMLHVYMPCAKVYFKPVQIKDVNVQSFAGTYSGLGKSSAMQNYFEARNVAKERREAEAALILTDLKNQEAKWANPVVDKAGNINAHATHARHELAKAWKQVLDDEEFAETWHKFDITEQRDFCASVLLSAEDQVGAAWLFHNGINGVSVAKLATIAKTAVGMVIGKWETETKKAALIKKLSELNDPRAKTLTTVTETAPATAPATVSEVDNDFGLGEEFYEIEQASDIFGDEAYPNFAVDFSQFS